MTRWARKLAWSLLMAGVATSLGVAQSGTQEALATPIPGPSEISRVKVVPDKGSLAIEITSTRQVIPTVIRLDGPQPRLIIDLPNAQLSVPRVRTVIHSGDIAAIRLAQYPMNPPVVQIIVELVQARGYTWEAAGNRLMVRLQDEPPERQEVVAAEGAPTAPAKAVAQTIAPASIVKPSLVTPSLIEPSLVKPSNVVFLDRLASGSLVSGGDDTAVLRLSRGEVHVCPGTTVSVSRSQERLDRDRLNQSRPEMMLAVSTGALETHYTLGDSTDSILTPDFRILLRGPGEFHFAIKVDSQGNACVRSLPGNTGSMTVSELIGSGEREVRAGDQLVFHSGRFTEVDSGPLDDCGCSAHAVPVIRTSLPAPPPVSDTAPMPVLAPNDIHVQVDVPLVFPDRNRPQETPAGMEESNQLPVRKEPQGVPPAEAVSLSAPAPAQAKPPRSGFLGKLKGLMAGMFR